MQTFLDAAALLPVVGSLKYTDEAADLLKAAAKHGDEATDAAKSAKKKAILTDAANEKPLKIKDNKKIKFENSSKKTSKLNNQIRTRGWTFESITKTVNEPFQIRTSINRATGNTATVYYDKDGSYVIVDNITNEIVQVSNRFDPNWKPDISIIDPYIKE